MTLSYCQLDWPEENIARITLSRPDKLNAINIEMLAQWQDILDALLGRPTLKCLILTGDGRAFSAGADLSATITVAQSYQGDLGQVLERHYYPVMKRLQQIPCPIVTAVNGLAVGVGFSFALYGDIIYAAQSAYFWANFSDIGLVPDGAMTYFLPRAIGFRKASDIIFLAEKISAERALTMGLVTQVYPDDLLQRESEQIARRLAGRSKIVNQELKKLLSSEHGEFLEQAQMECRAQTRAGHTRACRDALQRFLSKKKSR